MSVKTQKNKVLKSTKNDLSLVVKEIIAYAVAAKKPIVIEDLDFQQKKKSLVSVKELKSNGINGKQLELEKNYNMMLSSFAYNQFKILLSARCIDAGVELILVNPTYSSVIGKIKYKARNQITIHQSAALVLARRGLYSDIKVKVDFKERLKVKNGNNWFIEEKTIWYKEKLPKKLQALKNKEDLIKAKNKQLNELSKAKKLAKENKNKEKQEKEIKKNMENQNSIDHNNINKNINMDRNTQEHTTGLVKKPFVVNFWEDWKWAASLSKKSKVVLSQKTKPQSGSKTQDTKACTVDRLN